MRRLRPRAPCPSRPMLPSCGALHRFPFPVDAALLGRRFAGKRNSGYRFPVDFTGCNQLKSLRKSGGAGSRTRVRKCFTRRYLQVCFAFCRHRGSAHERALTRPSRKIFRFRVSGTPGNGIPLHLRPVQPRGGKVGGTALGYFLGSEREVNIIVRSCLRSAFNNAETEIRDLQPGLLTPVETIRPQIEKDVPERCSTVPRAWAP